MRQRQEEQRRESGPGKLKRFIGRNGRKMTPRVSAMFEHYNPSSPGKLHSTVSSNLVMAMMVVVVVMILMMTSSTR